MPSFATLHRSHSQPKWLAMHRSGAPAEDSCSVKEGIKSECDHKISV
jgi:hypothetical protein